MLCSQKKIPSDAREREAKQKLTQITIQQNYIILARKACRLTYSIDALATIVQDKCCVRARKRLVLSCEGKDWDRNTRRGETTSLERAKMFGKPAVPFPSPATKLSNP